MPAKTESAAAILRIPKGKPAVKSRSSRLATSGLVIAAILLIPGFAGAVYYALGPSKDEWGLKYAVEVSPVDSGKLNVRFTLAA